MYSEFHCQVDVREPADLKVQCPAEKVQKLNISSKKLKHLKRTLQIKSHRVPYILKFSNGYTREP